MRRQLLAEPRRAQTERPGQVRPRLTAGLRLGGGDDPGARAGPAVRRAAESGVRRGQAGGVGGVAAGVGAAGAHAIAVAQVHLGPESARGVNGASRERERPEILWSLTLPARPGEWASCPRPAAPPG